MPTRPARVLLILLLGVVVAFAQGLSVAQAAGQMTMKPAAMADMSGMGAKGCDRCDHDGGHAKATHCAPACVSADHALLSAAWSLRAPVRARAPMPDPVRHGGLTARPDPYPPKYLARV
jgi:hypothetical protein